MKDPLPRIPFVTWQLPQDHLIFLSVHMREKRHRQRVGGKKKPVVQFPRVREGENIILLLCLSQSHIRSDHWRIKAHPDTSLPLSGGSWHALGTRNDSGGGAQDEEVFFDRAKERRGKQRWTWHTCSPDPQSQVRWRRGGEGRAAWDKEVKRH